METQKLQDKYNLVIHDGAFRKKFQPLLTEEFLDWWFMNIPTPEEADWNQQEYFERMSWMLIGWLGSNQDLKELHENNDMEKSDT